MMWQEGYIKGSIKDQGKKSQIVFNEKIGKIGMELPSNTTEILETIPTETNNNIDPTTMPYLIITQTTFLIDQYIL